MAIVYDMPFAEYRALPGWNWSLIKLLDEHSPRAVKHAMTQTDTDTPSRGLLRAIHCLVLEPDNFAAGFAVFDGIRRGAKYDAHVEANAWKTTLNPKEYAAAKATAEAVLSHPVAAMLLSSGRGEVTVTWDDAETGLPCKGRCDWLGSALVDLKTLGSTNERTIARMVAQQHIHGQMAHYTAGLEANGVRVPAYIIAAEGKGAQDVAVFEIDPGVPDGSLHVGKALRSRLMRRLKECVDLDYWPGRHPEAQSLCLPMYALIDAGEEITFGHEPEAEEVF